MIEIVLRSEDVAKLEATLKQFGRDAPEIFDKILASVSSSYRGYVQKNFLSGQMLRRVTGTLWKSMRYKKSRNRKHQYIISAQPKLANIYEHVGGVDIRPVKAKALSWKDSAGNRHFARHVRLASRPFMYLSSNWFNFGGAFDASCDKVVAKEMKKRGIG